MMSKLPEKRNKAEEYLDDWTSSPAEVKEAVRITEWICKHASEKACKIAQKEKADEIFKEIDTITTYLYELNAHISLQYIGLKKTPTVSNMGDINNILGTQIKHLRELNKKHLGGKG